MKIFFLSFYFLFCPCWAKSHPYEISLSKISTNPNSAAAIDAVFPLRSQTFPSTPSANNLSITEIFPSSTANKRGKIPCFGSQTLNKFGTP